MEMFHHQQLNHPSQAAGCPKCEWSYFIYILGGYPQTTEHDNSFYVLICRTIIHNKAANCLQLAVINTLAVWII